MPITQLTLKNFRNLSHASLKTSPQFNIIFGENGSGKTSLLEAIYYLGFCRSFRTNQISHIIEHQQPGFQVYSEMTANGQNNRIGLERTITGGRSIRLNGEAVRNASTIAEQLPIQFLSTESYRFFHDGPKRRRQFLDWGLFHMKHQFYPLWVNLQKAYKQRNACLKNSRHYKEIGAWNHQLAALAAPIDEFRQDYVLQLKPILHELLSSMLNIELFIEYSRGWDQNKELALVLEQNYQRDLQLGYTYFGPNRADLQLYIHDMPAHEFLSQGQQKTASYALCLAQGILMQKSTARSPIYLIDDMPSELDPMNRGRIASVLQQIDAQVFITGITMHDLSETLNISDAKLFSIEKGLVTPK